MGVLSRGIAVVALIGVSIEDIISYRGDEGVVAFAALDDVVASAAIE